MLRSCAAAVLAPSLLLFSLGCGGSPKADAPSRQDPASAAPAPPTPPPHTTTSHYVPMRDGTRIAVDVHLPVGRPATEKFPALLELTRYRRATLDAKTGQ